LVFANQQSALFLPFILKAVGAPMEFLSRDEGANFLPFAGGDSSDSNKGFPESEAKSPFNDSAAIHFTAASIARPKVIFSRHATVCEIVDAQAPLAVALNALASGVKTLSGFSGDTGSSGNMGGLVAHHAGMGGEVILIDCPFGRAKLQSQLKALALSLASSEVDSDANLLLRRPVAGRMWLDHLLVTHLHSDHFRDDAAKACIELGITVHIPAGARKALRELEQPAAVHTRMLAALSELDRVGLLQEFAPGQQKRLGSFLVTAQRAMHDIPANCFLVQSGSLSVFHSGDTGSYTQEMFSLLERAHVWMGDGNYAANLIDVVPRNVSVLERTKSLTGHMGNIQNAEVLRTLSMGANSPQLQLAVMLHRSSATNYPENEKIIEQISQCWSDETAGRFCPAIVIAEKGPQFLFSIANNKQMVLPHQRATLETNKGPLLQMGFGETGLSMRLARDVMPELSRRMQTERAKRMHAIIESPNLRTVPDTASVVWRVPSKVAIVNSREFHRLRFLAPITICHDSASGSFRAYIAKELLQAGGDNALADAAVALNTYIDDKRSNSSSSDYFKLSEQEGKLQVLQSTSRINANEVNALTSILESELLGGVSRVSFNCEKSEITWRIPGRLAVLITDDVIFPRTDLADVVVAYNTQRQKLTIEIGGESNWQRCCADISEVSALLERFSKEVPEVGANLKTGSAPIPENLGNWKLSNMKNLGGVLKFRPDVVLSAAQVHSIASILRSEINWN